MERADVLLYLIERFGYQSYLEIGCLNDETFSKIGLADKVGVDPHSGGTQRMTSDQFFAQNERQFDLVFIDGDHAAEQVNADLANALLAIPDHGAVVLHDSVPITRAMTGRWDGNTAYWTGDVWWVVAKVAQGRADVDVGTIRDNWGVSVVFKRPRSYAPWRGTFTWEEFVEHEREMLNAMTWTEMRKWIG